MSRWLSPGDWQSHGYGLRDEVQHHNRTYIGQIQDINVRDGTIDVAINTTGQRFRMVIPITGLSVNGFQSSWIRYMPQRGDFVKIGFGPDNRPQCLGMAAWGNDNNVGGAGTGRTAYHQGGYARIARLAAEQQAGMDEFTELAEGEWDFRSSGGAYVKGSNTGTLLLMGGTAKIEVNKTVNEVRVRAPMYDYSDGGVQLRLGDVKRRLTLVDLNDSVVVDSTKAYELTIDSELAPGVVNKYYECRIGDVHDTTTPYLTTFGTFQGPFNPLRVHTIVKDGGISPIDEDVLEIRVDDAGNVDLISEAAVTIKAADRVDLGTENPLVGIPNDAVVRGTTYRTNEGIMNSTLSTQELALGTAWTAALPTTAALLLKLSGPPPAPPPSALSDIIAELTAWVTAIQTLSGAATTAHNAKSGAILAFEAPATTYLSGKVFTE